MVHRAQLAGVLVHVNHDAANANASIVAPVRVLVLVSVVFALAVTAVAGASTDEDCTAQTDPFQDPCAAVAVVDGDAISLAEFAHWLEIAGRSGGQMGVAPHDAPQFIRCIAAKRKGLPTHKSATRAQLKRQCASEYRAMVEQVMQLLISFRWIGDEAAAQGVAVSTEEVARTFKEQKRASFPKRGDYVAFLKRSGQTRADILMRVELDLLSNKLRERVGRGRAPVTDEEVARYYRRNRERFALPERRRLRLVVTKGRYASLVARQRIEAGERWAAVARDLSVDRPSRSQGSSTTFFKGQQARALNRAVFAARRGRVVGPLRAAGRWFLFKVVRVRPAQQQTLAQAAPTIKQLLKSRHEQDALDVFVRDFTKRWRAKTTCRAGYVTSDCANGPSLSEPAPSWRAGPAAG